MGKNTKRSCKNPPRNSPDLITPRVLFKKPVFSKKPRSSMWRKVRAEHLKIYNACMACGGRVSLEVHHLMPYQIAPELELDHDNLITLCEGRSRCHWIVGHLLNWRSYNPNAKADALAFFNKVKDRPVI